MTGDAGLGGSSQPPKRRTGRAARPRLRGHLGSPAGVQARGPRRQLRRAAKLRGWRARGRRGGGGAAGRGDRGSAATSARAPRLRFRVRPPPGGAAGSHPRNSRRGRAGCGECGAGRGQAEFLSADRLGFGTETDTNRRRGRGAEGGAREVQLVTED